MKIYIIHHNDPDGRMAGFIMYKHFTEKYEGTPIETLEANYEMTFNFSKYTKDDIVCIVDYSLNNRWYSALTEKVDKGNIIWIDHHKSAIDGYPEQKDLKGIRIDGLSGCELSQLYYMGYRQREHGSFDLFQEENPDNVVNAKEIEIPEVVRLIGDYDCWRHEIKNSLEFVFGIESIWNDLVLTTPEGREKWQLLYDSKDYVINFYIGAGKHIVDYLNSQNAIAVKERGFICKLRKFTQYKAIALNASGKSSNMFKSVFNEYEIGIVFTYAENPKRMSFSIYRLGLNPEKEIDCGQIAKSFGGGGHPGAAGFTTSGTLPFIYD